MNEQERLDSWKAIGAYLQRDERTVRRWEKEEGLPVHRHSHKSRSSVYAHPSEIDAWRAGRKVVPEPAPPRRLWKTPAFALTIVLCLIMVGNGVRPVSAQQAPQPRQVWTHSGGGGWTISPDGRYVAFPAYDGATQNLGLHDLVTGSDIRLTHNDNPREYLSKPVFSLDGKQIAFTWYHPPAAAEVRVMSIDGGTPGAARLLFKQDEVNSPFVADWSPDGKWIAAKFYRTDRTAQLALISATDGSVRVLKTVDMAAPAQVYFSPDNRYLAHTRLSDRASKDPDIYLLAIDGGQEIPAVVHPADDSVVGWSTDGQLLFISNRNGSNSLWSQAMDSGKPQGNPQLLLPNFGATLSFYMGATRTGDLYYTALAGSTKIAVATVDWNSGKISTSQEFTRGIQPEWSPDGKSLAFKALRQDSSPYLGIQSLETGQSRELHPKMASFNWPRWSPDGKSFLLQGTDDRARQGIFRMDAATGELQAVALAGAGEGFGMPQWFPDGKRILYQSRPFSPGKSVKSIRERDLKSGHEREIVSGADLPDDNAGRLTVVLSPDGRSLAHVREDPATKQGSLNLVSLKDGRTRELVRFGADKQIMVNGWTPDSKSLIYSEREGSVRLSDGHEEPDFATWIVPVEGGAARKIELDEPWARQVRVHPDGKRIAFWIPNNTPEQVWVVENVRPKAPAR